MATTDDKKIIFSMVGVSHTIQQTQKQVLKNIYLSFFYGAKIGIIGLNGAGKSTLMKIIAGLIQPTQGEVVWSPGYSVGYLEQDPKLDEQKTVKENIMYGKLDATDEEVIAAAKLANADGFIRRLPKGYDTMLTGDGANLSQGQRQLLAIARAAIADPPVLILDEATSSIDTRTEKIVQEGMDKLMHGRTTFVIAHRLSTVKNSDCIIVLEQGRIVEMGNHDELIAKKQRYYQLYTGNKPEEIA